MQIPNPPAGRPLPDGQPTPADRDRLDAFKAYVARLQDPGSVDMVVAMFNRVYAGTFASREDYGRERAGASTVEDVWDYVDRDALADNFGVGDLVDFVDYEALMMNLTVDDVWEHVDVDALAAGLDIDDVMEYVDFEAFADDVLAGRCNIVDSDGCVHLFRD